MSSLSSEAHIFNPSSCFVQPFFSFCCSYLPSPFLNVKTYAVEEKEKADFCCSTLQPLILSASFSLFETRRAWSHQSPSLCVFSLAVWLIAIVKKTPSKAALPSPFFVFLGDTVMSDGVTFFRCRSARVRRSSPPPRRQLLTSHRDKPSLCRLGKNCPP